MGAASHVRSLTLPQNAPGAPAGLLRSPEPAEAHVQKALADSEEAGILTAVIPKPCEALCHRLLESHFSPHDPQCQPTPCSPHTGEAYRWKAHRATLGVQCGRMEEEQRGLSVTSKVSECRLYSLHPTWSFEKQVFNHAWHVPGTKHLEEKIEPIPGDLVTASVCQRTGGGSRSGEGETGSITPGSLNEQSCS